MMPPKNEFFWKEFINQSEEPDLVSRYLEVIFGTIMVLSFTASVSISHDGSAEIHHLLWAALSCNVAWGIIDGITFIITGLLERSRKMQLVHDVQHAKSKDEAIAIGRQALQKFIAIIIEPAQLDELYEKIMALPPPPKRVPIRWSEVKEGMVIFMAGFIATFPMAIPFVFMKDPIMAKYISDGVGMSTLFICGYAIGKNTGLHPWLAGFSMTLISIAFFMITMVLGG